MPGAATGGRLEIEGQVRVQGLGLTPPVAVSARPVLIDPSRLTVAEPKIFVMGRTLDALERSTESSDHRYRSRVETGTAIAGMPVVGASDPRS